MEKLKEKERELKKKKVQKGSYQRNKTVSTFRGGRDRDKDRNRTINNSKIYQENKSMGHFLRKDKDNRKKIDLKYITFTPRRGEEKSKSFLISKTDARTEVERNKRINEKKLITNLSIKGKEDRQKSKSKGKIIKKEEKKEEKKEDKKIDIRNKNNKRSSRISIREKEKDKKDSKKDIKKEDKTKIENKNKSKFDDKKEIKNIDKYKKRESKIKEEKKEIAKLVKKEVKKDDKKMEKKEDSKNEEKGKEEVIETKTKLEENIEKEKIDDKDEEKNKKENLEKKEEKPEIQKEVQNPDNNTPQIEKENINQQKESQTPTNLENKEEIKEKEDPKKRLFKYLSKNIVHYLNYDEIKTLLLLSKDSAKSIIPFLKELNTKNLQESQNDLNRLKSNNNEELYKADIIPLKLSKASIKALEKLNEEEYQKLFTSEKAPESRDIILIYRLFLQLLNKNDNNKIKEQKDNEFWIFARDKLFVNKEGNFGDYIKALIEQIDFSKENLKEVNDFCKIYKDKLNQKYISSLCHTTGLFFVFIRDILDYCGIFESNKASIPLNYQRLEYNYNFYKENEEKLNKITEKLKI